MMPGGSARNSGYTRVGERCRVEKNEAAWCQRESLGQGHEFDSLRIGFDSGLLVRH